MRLIQTRISFVRNSLPADAVQITAALGSESSQLGDGGHVIKLTMPSTLNDTAALSAHLASHWGSCVCQALLSAQFKKPKTVSLTLAPKTSEQLSDKSSFLLGLMQRSATIKGDCPQMTVHVSPEIFSESDIKRAETINEAMLLTRSLVNAPPNLLNPSTYEEFVKKIVADSNQTITLEVLDSAQLIKDGCGLITAVGKGSEHAPRILRLTYVPKETTKSKVAKVAKISLVGKGITFDSGGLNMKGAPFMRNMKKDMGGSAAALGAFIGIAKLQLPMAVTCILAIAENMVAHNAMRPGDVYVARNGISVEIDNTDAEGRLVLADALTYAVEDKSDVIIDLATLTGACRVALGPWIDGLFGNSTEWIERIKTAANKTGDWVWHMPMMPDYDAMYDSSVADIANSGAGGHAGAITAAQFMKRFVNNSNWCHLDTYMWTDKPNDLNAQPGGTAKCVRLLIQMCEDLI